MPRFNCRLAFLRAGLEHELAPTALERVVDAFERAGNDAGVEPFRLLMDTSAATAHRLPDDLVTNNALLGRTLESILAGAPRTDLGVRDIALLFADELHEHPGVLGVMFDTGFRGVASQDAIPRQGCAVFLGALRRARPTELQYRREVVFTTAHELGHLFNLWHVQDPVSLMSSSPAGENAHPTARQTFGPPHKTFLRRCATSRFVHPGGSDFGVRGDLGPPGGAFTSTLRRAPEVTLTIHVEEGEFWRFEPVELDISVSTRAHSPLTLPDTVDPGYDEFVVWIEDPRGERRRYRSPRCYCRNLGSIELRRGRPFRRDLSLFAGAGGYTFRVPGEHSVWVEWTLGGRSAPLRSNVVSLLVKTARPEDRRYRQLAEDLTAPDVARILYHRTGPLGATAGARLRRATERRQSSLPAALEYALGRAHLAHSQRLPDAWARARARRHLQKAIRGLSRRCNRHRRALEILERLG